jgi:cell division protein FtsB
MRIRTLMAFIILEVSFFGALYMRGAHGWRKLQRLQDEEQGLTTETSTLEEQIGVLEQRIADWKEHSFYTEQVARERLHMARPTELFVMV